MQFEVKDISYQVYGKYVHCTDHDGLAWSDDDFAGGYGYGELKIGAIPSPYQSTPERRARAAEITEAGGWSGPPVAARRNAEGDTVVPAILLVTVAPAVLALIFIAVSHL